MPSKSKTKTKTKTTKPPAMPAIEVTNLVEIESLAKPVHVEVQAEGKIVRFTGRRLLPGEVGEVRHRMVDAMPPLLPPEKEGGQLRYDMANPEFRKRRYKNERMARSLAIWYAFPAFRRGADGADLPLSDHEQIHRHIEGLNVEDDLLEALYKKLTVRTVLEPDDAGAYQDFT